MQNDRPAPIQKDIEAAMLYNPNLAVQEIFEIEKLLGFKLVECRRAVAAADILQHAYKGEIQNELQT